jgi:diguanylate cyclase (GGDEF)-like protein
VIVMTMAASLAALVYLTTGSHERRREQRTTRESEQRLRSLVEGSQDIITVVAGADDLAVISPNLGVLERLVRGSFPSRLSEVLSSAAFGLWRTCDQRLRVTGGHHVVELTIEATDGATLHLEGHGSILVSDPVKRVWVWRDVTDRKDLEMQLRHQAFHDSLTGVANRALLVDRVKHALSLATRSNSPVTVMFCDLDNFKLINDAVGHGHGDEVLKIISRRLQSCVRPSDTIARLGGDEFAILLENTSVRSAAALAERIIGVVSYEVDLADRTFVPSISIGIATAVADATAEELLRNADIAMYRAKRSGKGRAEIYADQMQDDDAQLVELHRDLGTALAAGQLGLHYQPMINLKDGSVEGVEALLRWRHPKRGDLLPEQFIHLAESSGLILPIGRWVIQEACRAAVELQGSGLGTLYMAVNLSPIQLNDPKIINTVKHALEDSGLAAERLVLEVTEGCLLDNPSALRRLQELRGLGVAIALDDFGTGYTSLTYLQTLPIGVIKIDRSFVSGDTLAKAERAAFLNAIIGLARSLNLRLVAEGLEDLSQIDELTSLGCEAGQGFFWSRAVPLDMVAATILDIQESSDRRECLVTSP